MHINGCCLLKSIIGNGDFGISFRGTIKGLFKKSSNFCWFVLVKVGGGGGDGGIITLGDGCGRLGGGLTILGGLPVKSGVEQPTFRGRSSELGKGLITLGASLVLFGIKSSILGSELSAWTECGLVLSFVRSCVTSFAIGQLGGDFGGAGSGKGEETSLCSSLDTF